MPESAGTSVRANGIGPGERPCVSRSAAADHPWTSRWKLAAACSVVSRLPLRGSVVSRSNAAKIAYRCCGVAMPAWCVPWNGSVRRSVPDGRAGAVSRPPAASAPPAAAAAPAVAANVVMTARREKGLPGFSLMRARSLSINLQVT